jgi:hypothetical protein
MRQGPLELLRLSSETSERAGRRPAPSFPDSSGAAELPKLLCVSFRCPGLTASFPAAQELRSGEVARRFVVPGERAALRGPTLPRVWVQNAPLHASGHDHDLARDVT